MPENMLLLSLTPTAAVIAVAIFTHRPLFALLVGCMAGQMLLSGADFYTGVIDGAIQVFMDPTTVWVILAVGLFGSLSRVIEVSGGAFAFGRWVSGHLRSRSQVMLGAWLLGLVVFVDDYLNALVVGTAMKPLADHEGVSREQLAYVVDSTAAPVCVLVPISGWAVYVIGLLESSSAISESGGFAFYVEAIPFMFYPWVALLMVPLFALGAIPLLGPMRHTSIPEQSEVDAAAPEWPHNGTGSPAAFIGPIGAFMLFTWAFEMDILKGAGAAVAVSVGALAIARQAGWSQLFAATADGFSGMTPVLGIVVASFLLRDINEALGLTTALIDAATPVLSAMTFGPTIFVVLALIAFATGSFWGMYAIALPIVLPLAAQLGVEPALALGVLVSAGAFGSHACFYGDSTVLSAQATGCSPMAHATTQLPYAAAAAVVSTGGFAVASWLY